jgi:hypothetical protein
MTDRFRGGPARPGGPSTRDEQLSFVLDGSVAPAPRSRDLAVAPPVSPPALPPASPPEPAPNGRHVSTVESGRLHARLRALGLRGIERLRVTRNRTVMVSFSGTELRIHEGYLDAPDEVLQAVVRFVCGRTRAERSLGRDVILAHKIARPAPARRREVTRPEDEPLIEQLRRFHGHYNRLYFGGRLTALPIRLSGRMRTRLGHYTAASPTGEAAEIVIGRDHIGRHGWEEALHTLLHEMVHQWQDESGHVIDHGTTFRTKAREVGITASARRHVMARRNRQAAAHQAKP